MRRPAYSIDNILFIAEFTHFGENGLQPPNSYFTVFSKYAAKYFGYQ